MKKNYMKKMGLLTLFSLFMVFTMNVKAQVANYSFSAISGTYTPLVGGTASSLTATADDALSAAITLPFSFKYNNISYTNVKVSSNGPLLFGTAPTSSTLTNNLATTTTTARPGVAALWDDLQCTTGVTYQVSGTAPNRIFTAEWKNMEWNWSSNTAVISFQVKLYETTNVIEFVYQQEATAVNAGTASIGIMGTTTSDFISLQDVSAAPVTSIATSANSLATKPATGQIYRWTPPNPAAPVITQAAGVPSCATGTDLDIPAAAPANVVWYWQANATDQLTTTPYAGPITVFNNGTYYANAYNTALGVWSFTNTAFTVSNFPVATPPAAATAGATPICAPATTDLTAATAPAGYEYYWQGTTMGGTSTAMDAATPYTVSTSGTYYLAAYETATSCWSNTVGTTVVVDTYIPSAPTATPDVYDICSGLGSQMITATAPGSGSATVNFLASSPYTWVQGPATLSGTLSIPAGAVVTSSVLTFNGITTTGGTWLSDLDYSLSGAATLALANLPGGSATNAGPFTFNPTGTTSGVVNLNLNNTWSDNATVNAIDLVVTYTLPVSTTEWFDMATAGANIGSGSTIETVGTSVMPGISTAVGNYEFYAESVAGACKSTSRELVTVNVLDVNVTLAPIDATCNGSATGSFILAAVDCGTPGFTYSIAGVNGGAYGPIPNNLIAGTYTVTVKDNAGNLSPAYTITIADAPAPDGLVMTTTTDDGGQVSWNGNGTEVEWYVEWGLPGFLPGTGNEIGAATATDTFNIITGLDANTTYDVYVAANCGATQVIGDWVSITFTTDCAIYGLPFIETFEDDSETRACWTNNQEVGTANWTYQTGSNGTVTSAFEGTLNARFVSQSGTSNPITKLESPRFDFTGQDSVAVIFAHAQQAWGSDQNITKVYVNSLTSSWVEIASYNAPDAEWQVDTLFVADTTLQIAFEGINNWGYANVVDYVQVLPCTITPGIDGATDFCRLDGDLDLNTLITKGEDFGRWDFPINQSFLNGSVVNTTLLPAGVYEFYYIVSTPCADADTTFATVTIYGPSSAGVDGTFTACKNEPINLLSGLSGNIDLGGTWYDPANAVTPANINASNFAGSYNYDYITGNGVCPNDTSNIVLTVLGTCDYLDVQELFFGGMEVYPNPTKGMVFVTNNGSEEIFNYEITDVNGKIINAKKAAINGIETVEIDLGSLETGLYIVRIFNESAEKSFRIVKQ